MAILPKLSLLISFGIAFFLCTQLLVKQTQLFLLEHSGPTLTQLQIFSVTSIFICTGLILAFCALFNDISWFYISRGIILLAWGIPMVLLDVRNCWLPFRYTTGFWITGLLFTLLPESDLSLIGAICSSSVMFIMLYAFHTVALYLRGNEGFGVGDVHLIAAISAWFPWHVASLLSGYAFLCFVIGSLLTRQTEQPYAPWLFAILTLYVLAGAFHQTSIPGVL